MRKRSFGIWKIVQITAIEIRPGPSRGRREASAASDRRALALAARLRRGAVSVALSITSSRLSVVVDRPPIGAGDRRDDLLAGRVIDVEGRRAPAEAQDHDPVGDLEDVGEVVADHDHPEAALAQALDQAEHLRGLRDAQRRRRLVEQHDLRLAEQRAGDRHRLALPAGERADLGADAPGWSPTSSASSSTRVLLHLDLVEDRERDAALPISSWPRNRLATTSRLSHSARSW